MEGSLSDFLAKQGIPCLYDVDTRAVTRKIRSAGTMKGIIVPEDAAQTEIDELFAVPIKKDVVNEVTTPEVYTMETDGPSVVVMDFGIKRNILNSLHHLGCSLTVVPAQTSAREILALQPDGIFLSNGPGDPLEMTDAAATVAELEKHLPIFGICMGHQIFALANGAKTYKMKFGHRGFNHPVRNLQTGKIAFTSQNHGFAVDPSSIDDTDLQITHLEVNDGRHAL